MRVRTAAEKECREAAEWSRKHPHVEEEEVEAGTISHRICGPPPR